MVEYDIGASEIFHDLPGGAGDARNGRQITGGSS
jgi:hypothetical protein